MQEFVDKVAVVTGAASGIGKALATRFASAGMRVVLVDIEREALAAAEAELRESGATTLAVPTDVTSADEVDALAQRTREAFGGVHLLCNNAGVAIAGPIWEHTIDDWQWVLGVNLWGVIHGIRTFVPIMLEQGEEAHVVNTASVAGLTSFQTMGVYNVTKHAVVTLSETLARDLDDAGAKIKVSVLCPGFVATKILDSDRNRPEALADGAEREPGEMEEIVRQVIATGMPPAEVAEHVHRAVRDERFYILTHPDYRAQVRERFDDIFENRMPVAMPIAR